jgi:uroporphyrinogen-III synthase
LGVKRVLVTRPEPGATRTAERLASLGYEPIKMPLSETLGLQPKFDQEQIDFVIATSAQAFSWLPEDIAARLADLPTFVVGTATGDAAKSAGFKHVHVCGNGISELLVLLQGRLSAHTKSLYLCGKVRRPELEQSLRNRDTPFEIIEVYDTILVSYSTDKLKFLRDIFVDAVLVTSVTNAQALTHLIEAHNLSQAFENTTFICQSQRIADGLKLGDSALIVACETANSDTMIAQLALHCPL